MLRGAAKHDATPAYGPIVGALRSHLRTDPDRVRRVRAARRPPPGAASRARPGARRGDRETLREAIRCALVSISGPQGALLALDDLQWADAATLELISELAPTLDGMSLLVIGAYRSDELAREHPLRRMRNELRRTKALHEVSLSSLDEAGTAELLAAGLGDQPSKPLHPRRARPVPGPSLLRRGDRRHAVGGRAAAPRPRRPRARRRG